VLISSEIMVPPRVGVLSVVADRCDLAAVDGVFWGTDSLTLNSVVGLFGRNWGLNFYLAESSFLSIFEKISLMLVSRCILAS